MQITTVTTAKAISIYQNGELVWRKELQSVAISENAKWSKQAVCESCFEAKSISGKCACEF